MLGLDFARVLAVSLPGPLELVVIALVLLVIILPYWKIFSKAGFPGWLGLLMATPLNVILLFYLAFAKWPLERELERLKHAAEGV